MQDDKSNGFLVIAKRGTLLTSPLWLPWVVAYLIKLFPIVGQVILSPFIGRSSSYSETPFTTGSGIIATLLFLPIICSPLAFPVAYRLVRNSVSRSEAFFKGVISVSVLIFFNLILVFYYIEATVSRSSEYPEIGVAIGLFSALGLFFFSGFGGVRRFIRECRDKEVS